MRLLGNSISLLGNSLRTPNTSSEHELTGTNENLQTTGVSRTDTFARQLGQTNWSVHSPRNIKRPDSGRKVENDEQQREP